MNGPHLNFGMYIMSRNDERNYAQMCLNWGNKYKYIRIPEIIKPKTITAQNHYCPEKYGDTRQDLIEQCYGFMVYEECFWVYYGNRTHDSSTDQQLLFNIGWRDYTHIRWSGYDSQHNLVGHFEIGPHNWDYTHIEKLRDSIPKVKIQFNDYDEEEIIATCHIEEREWHKGRGWFTWLKFLSKPLIRRSICIQFNKETGSRKGSWKGGTIGSGEDMSPNETIFEAFSRYATKHNFTNPKEIE